MFQLDHRLAADSVATVDESHSLSAGVDIDGSS